MPVFEAQFLPRPDGPVFVVVLPTYIDALQVITDVCGDGLVIKEHWPDSPEKKYLYSHRLLDKTGTQVAIIVCRTMSQFISMLPTELDL